MQVNDGCIACVLNARLQDVSTLHQTGGGNKKVTSLRSKTWVVLSVNAWLSAADQSLSLSNKYLICFPILGFYVSVNAYILACHIYLALSSTVFKIISFKKRIEFQNYICVRNLSHADLMKKLSDQQSYMIQSTLQFSMELIIVVNLTEHKIWLLKPIYNGQIINLS